MKMKVSVRLSNTRALLYIDYAIGNKLIALNSPGTLYFAHRIESGLTLHINLTEKEIFIKYICGELKCNS